VCAAIVRATTTNEITEFAGPLVSKDGAESLGTQISTTIYYLLRPEVYREWRSDTTETNYLAAKFIEELCKAVLAKAFPAEAYGTISADLWIAFHRSLPHEYRDYASQHQQRYLQQKSGVLNKLPVEYM
jgi:hypothetical protein